MTENSESEIELSEDEFEDCPSEVKETENINDEFSAEDSVSAKESELDDEGLEEEVDGGDLETADSVQISHLAESAVAAAEESAEACSRDVAAEIITEVLADIDYNLLSSEISSDTTERFVLSRIEDLEEDDLSLSSRVLRSRSRNPSGESLSCGRVTRSKLSSDKESEGRWTHLRKRHPSNESNKSIVLKDAVADTTGGVKRERNISTDSGKVEAEEAPVVGGRVLRKRHGSSESSKVETPVSEGRVLRRRHLSNESNKAGPEEGRVLRRRHASNDSSKAVEPPRKTRAVRSISSENNEQSSRESTPSAASTPRSRSPARAADSIVVNLTRKKKKKEMFDGKARAEADTMKRISELQSQGMWLGKKMTKNQEERGKYHWDFVLEEMVWLSAVVQQELKTKKMLAKKCATMVQKHFKDREMAALRAEKAKEANLRRIASLMAREIKNFWGDVNKLFEYRLKSKLDAKRKEALDQHLNFIVDKTEKYSTLLAESMADNVNTSLPNSGAPSRSESVMSEELGEDNDLEYNPDVDSDDDEETIEKEEELNEDKNHDGEINDLENEADVPLEELLKKYYPDQFGDIEVDKKEILSPKVEAENEEKSDDLETDIKEEANDDKDETVDENSRSKRKRKPLNIEEVEAKIKAEDEGPASPADKTEEDKLEEYASLAATFQPTGNTLDTTTVKTKVPFLLRHTLREYQHIGLDWMVSLYERSLNGILADEMGLGKTIQTISFLAHLASDRDNWGPHLIVVPTSVMLNWEMEIKKWCPGFKVLVYYGSQKERRLKRVGWTKQNAFHICITSYKLVIQDHSSFRRFKWQYFILDEAQHIKNFKSQRWQLLLNFTSVGRLLLTGTPLQNNLMELWSLMHFLMPHVFESHRDFKEWFSNPMTGMVEGNMEYNNELVKRLHKVLRPFILRRLKREVEKQLPKKYEHLVKCPLSKRQRFLYDDFMSRAKTREILASGNLLSVINVLMQLRKCCNHPNLFEPRPTLSPFVMQQLEPLLPESVRGVLAYRPLESIDLASSPFLFTPLETRITAYTWFRCSSLRCPAATMLSPPLSPSGLSCPKDKIRFEIRAQNPPIQKHPAVEKRQTFCQLEQTNLGPLVPSKYLSDQAGWLWQKGVKLKSPQGYYQIKRKSFDDPIPNELDISPKAWDSAKLEDEVDAKKKPLDDDELFKHSKGIFSSSLFQEEKSLSSRSPSKYAAKRRKLDERLRLQELEMASLKTLRDDLTLNRRKRNLFLNDRRTNMIPIYGQDLRELTEQFSLTPSTFKRNCLEKLVCQPREDLKKQVISCYSNSDCPDHLVASMDQILPRLHSIFSQFIMYVPAVHVPAGHSICQVTPVLDSESSKYPGDCLVTRFQIQTPDTRLIQYDCGKLQVLAKLLLKLHTGGHRALIFTQMTKMLDVLESFLNYHGYVYMRLDGSTKVETRQCLMERFNNDKKYFIFILSTRSGGVGINLTGADTVIFYDSDWNPTMDAQAQDRCHRIGQTRDVHIYRLVSERTIEENIIKKANQKKLLGDLAIEGGNFTTAFFKKSTINDLFDETAAITEEDVADESEESSENQEKKKLGAFENALATAEEDNDIQASVQAKAEENADENDFKEEEDQFNAVLSELKSVERYALKHLEWEQQDFVQEQLEFAQAELDARKEEFDAGKLEELTQEMREELGLSSEEEDNGQTDEEQEEAGEEYAPNEDDSDDEVTIDKDEKKEQKDEFEVSMLENDAEIPVEDLLKMYYPDQWKQMQGEDAIVNEIEEQHVNGGRRSTRSRGNVEINLWELENPEEQLRSSCSSVTTINNKL